MWCLHRRFFAPTFIYQNASLQTLSEYTNTKHGNLAPYSLFNGYAAYLNNRDVSALTLKQRVVTIKNFFEYCDIDISPRKFKLKVKLPKIIRKKKEALSKEDIIEILNVCDNIRLKAYVMLLAATGYGLLRLYPPASLI